MQVLVTGGAGYIGSHTAKQLAAEGFTPIVLDNISTGHADAVRWGRLIEGDLGDRDLLRRVFRENRIDGVIHFAASAYVGESVRHPRAYFQNNVVKSLALFEEMIDAGIDQLVFSSSCATYGVPDTLPITEGQAQRPVNPYGESKLFVERALHAFGQAYGLRSVALRYFNAAGADPDGELGELHDPETHLVPLAIGAALGLGPALDVYGTDYATPDGTAVRDFIHVSDLASAHVAALRYLEFGGASTCLNLGTGHGHSVREVISTVEEVANRPVPSRDRGRRPGDPPILVADAALAREVLGWQPKYDQLRDIVDTAWSWHAHRLELAAIGEPTLATVGAR
jgi:UDP-arabinose 4-epimerase